MDEAGMTDSKSMLAVLQKIEKAGAKLVVGDDAQLQPVESRTTFRAIVEKIGLCRNPASLSSKRGMAARGHD